MHATAQIDIARPTGRRLVRNLEMHPKVTKVDYPLPPEIAGKKWYTLEEVREKGYNKLSKHYGVDVRTL